MRKKYYLISFLLGLVYFIGYLMIVNAYNWNYRAPPVIDLILLIASLGFLIGLTIKDFFDEWYFDKYKKTLGGPQIEHGPFILVVSLTLFVSIAVFPASTLIKVILGVLCVIDGSYDLFEDYRSKSLR